MNTKTLSVTLPPDVVARAEEIARDENRTVSELVGEALRQYERKLWWDQANAFGQNRARELRLNEHQVPELVKEVRHERRASTRK